MIIDPVIYVITNIVNDKQYVGQAVVKNKRWKDHRSALNTGKHSNRYLQAAYNKYGVDNFIYTVLEVITVDIDNLIKTLNKREQHWMDKLNTVQPNGYNLNPTAGNAIGFKHSVETKAKWSEQRKGKKRSAEFSMSVSIRMTGKIITEETRQKLIDSHKGKCASEETKAKMSVARKGNQNAAGQIQTFEHIEARAKVLRGKPKSSEHKAKIAAGNKGKIVSEETRQKQSEAAKRRHSKA